MQKKILFASDLDNTLLVSHRNRHAGDICVELNKGSGQSFMTQRGIEFLRQVNKRIGFVPITTRSLEQYRRIDWPDGCEPEYAVTTNGAILLRKGEVDENWSQRTRQIVDTCRDKMFEQQKILSSSKYFRYCRVVDDSYLFLYCSEDADIETCVEKCSRSQTAFTLGQLGRKIYLFPSGLGKGEALKRLKEHLLSNYVYAAGDSPMDVSMLNVADMSFAPTELKGLVGENCLFQPDGILFSEWLLDEINKRMESAMKGVFNVSDSVASC